MEQDVGQASVGGAADTAPAEHLPPPSAPAVDAPVDNQPAKPDSVPQKPMSVRESIDAAVKEEKAKRGNPFKDPATGKFTNKPDVEAPKEAAPQEIKNLEAKPEVLNPPQAVTAPKAWPKEKHALWDQLPQEAKDFLLTRERQVDEGFAKFQGIEPKYRELDSVLAPHREMIRQYGVSEGQFVNQMLSWHGALSNPASQAQAFAALANAYGYNPQGSSPAEIPQGNDVSHLLRPHLDQFGQQINGLRQEVSSVRNQLSQREQEIISRDIAEFAKDKPHFEKVRTEMGLLIKAAAESGKELSLDEAYQKAIWATPDIREQLKKAEFEAQIAKQREDADKAMKAKAATLAGRSPAPAAANGSKPMSVREALTKSVAELRQQGRA